MPLCLVARSTTAVVLLLQLLAIRVLRQSEHDLNHRLVILAALLLFDGLDLSVIEAHRCWLETGVLNSRCVTVFDDLCHYLAPFTLARLRPVVRGRPLRLPRLLSIALTSFGIVGLSMKPLSVQSN